MPKCGMAANTPTSVTYISVAGAELLDLHNRCELAKRAVRSARLTHALEESSGSAVPAPQQKQISLSTMTCNYLRY